MSLPVLVSSLLRRSLACLFALVLAMPAPARAEGFDIEQTQQVDHDTDFYVAANQANLLMVQTSELALKRGLSGPIQEYAKKMVVEHTRADAELAALAEENGVTISAILNQTSQAHVDALAQHPDRDFEAAYLQAHIDAHRRAIDRFTAAASRTSDPRLQALVRAELPRARAHLDEAERLAAAR